MGNVSRFVASAALLLLCAACGATEDTNAMGSGTGSPDPSEMGSSTGQSNMGQGGAAQGGGGETPNGEMLAGGDTPIAPGSSTDPEQTPAGPSTRVFLLFGQSNMWGVPNPEAQDLETNPRVEVLTLTACGAHGVDQWVTAQPPLHGCVGRPGNGTNGPGVGPGDYFARTLAAAFPEDTILLVPNAIPGVSIDVFQPGQPAYTSIVVRARIAQQRGTISGMIFHQGETDTSQTTWPMRVKTVVDSLRADLGLGEVPFIAGELLVGGCCSSHNPIINQLPNVITQTSVARAEGFTPLPDDGFGNVHFDLTSQREFGRRYAELMLEALGD